MAGLREFTNRLAVQIYNLNIYLDLDIIAIGGGISQQPLLHEYLQRQQPRISGCSAHNILSQNESLCL